MTEKRIGASATVTVTIEVEHGSSYGPGTTVDQIHDQARRETLQHLEATFQKERIRWNGQMVVNSINVKVVER